MIVIKDYLFGMIENLREGFIEGVQLRFSLSLMDCHKGLFVYD
jgi:hypothetical protein